MKIVIDIASEEEAQKVEALLQDHDLSYHREAPISQSKEPNSAALLAFIDQNPPQDDILDRIPDPVAWQRDIRKDRKLPGRS
ncbi:MAG: hypothetical protein WBA23_22905 [Tunicatimonas sp.]|uniref:hypothetical protein n=1 Tax=Tunicatimonas sp. TaxID=1940096 RepID=UPI003C76C308